MQPAQHAAAMPPTLAPVQQLDQPLPIRTYRGVSYDAVNVTWRSRIYCLGKHLTLGRFVSVQEAAFQHDRAAYFLFGENARTNYGVAAARDANTRAPPATSWRVMSSLEALAAKVAARRRREIEGGAGAAAVAPAAAATGQHDHPGGGGRSGASACGGGTALSMLLMALAQYDDASRAKRERLSKGVFQTNKVVCRANGDFEHREERIVQEAIAALSLKRKDLGDGEGNQGGGGYVGGARSAQSILRQRNMIHALTIAATRVG